MEQRDNSKLINWNGTVRTVSPDNLNILTSEGWKILDIYTEDVVEVVADEEPNQQPYKDGYSFNQGTVTTRRSHKCRRTQFLLGLDEKSTLFQKKIELQREQALAHSLQVELEDTKKALRETKETLDLRERARSTLESDVKRFQERLDSSKKTVADEQAKSRKLELDLAKVRQAVGDLRWGEILGDGTPQ